MAKRSRSVYVDKDHLRLLAKLGKSRDKKRTVAKEIRDAIKVHLQAWHMLKIDKESK